MNNHKYLRKLRSVGILVALFQKNAEPFGDFRQFLIGVLIGSELPLKITCTSFFTDIVLHLLNQRFNQADLERDTKASVNIQDVHGIDRAREDVNETLGDIKDLMSTITPFKFPSDDQMNSMNSKDLMYLFGQFTNSTQIQCKNRQVFRKTGDAGKTICVDEYIRPRKNCIVYSFGSDNDFSFEESVIRKFGCQVFTFDPSMSNLQQDEISAPEGCKFIPIGLGATNHINKDGWIIKTFDDVKKQLNHSSEIIDILKVDIEGSEWETFDQMLKDGSFDRVKQLQVEIHFYDNAFRTRCRGNREQVIDCYFKALEKHQVIVRIKRLALLKRLHDYGLKVFSSEGNMFYENSKEYIDENVFVTPLTEVSLINVNFLKHFNKKDV